VTGCRWTIAIAQSQGDSLTNAIGNGHRHAGVPNFPVGRLFDADRAFYVPIPLNLFKAFQGSAGSSTKPLFDWINARTVLVSDGLTADWSAAETGLAKSAYRQRPLSRGSGTSSANRTLSIEPCQGLRDENCAKLMRMFGYVAE
jgi:hypothetical protein